VCKCRFNFSVCLVTVRGEGLILIIYRISHYSLHIVYVTDWILLLYTFDVHKLVLTFRVCTDLLRVNLMFVYSGGNSAPYCHVFYIIYYSLTRFHSWCVCFVKGGNTHSKCLPLSVFCSVLIEIVGFALLSTQHYKIPITNFKLDTLTEQGARTVRFETCLYLLRLIIRIRNNTTGGKYGWCDMVSCCFMVWCYNMVSCCIMRDVIIWCHVLWCDVIIWCHVVLWVMI
jgi:hypothetical protein